MADIPKVPTAPIIVPSAPEVEYFGASEDERNQIVNAPDRIRRNILPIVQDPAYFIKNIAGKTPSTIPTRSKKAVGLFHWQTYDNSQDLPVWVSDYRLGFSLRGGADSGCLFIDFDSEDIGLHDWLLDTIDELNRNTPIRSRSNSLHFQALIQCDAPADDTDVWAKYEILKVPNGEIELRVDGGHQSVLFGTHQTGVRFEWNIDAFNGDPWDRDAVIELYSRIHAKVNELNAPASQNQGFDDVPFDDIPFEDIPSDSQKSDMAAPAPASSPAQVVDAPMHSIGKLGGDQYRDLHSLLLETKTADGKPLFDPSPRQSGTTITAPDGTQYKVPAYIEVTFALAPFRSDPLAVDLWNRWCCLTADGKAKHRPEDLKEFIAAGKAVSNLNGKPITLATLFKVGALMGWVAPSRSKQTAERKPLLAPNLFKDTWNDPPRFDPLVDGFFERGSTVILSGESGSGKTLLLFDLMRAVSLGYDWCDKPVTQGDVVLIATEGQNSLRNRLWANYKVNGMTDAECQRSASHIIPLAPDARGVVFGADPRDKSAESASALIEQQLNELGIKPVLFIIDTLSQTLLGDENSSADASRYLNDIRDHFARPFNACVIITHHYGKTSGVYRGSSAIRCNSDDMYTIESNLLGAGNNADGKQITLSCSQRRDSANPDNAIFTVHSITRDEDPAHPLIGVTFDRYGSMPRSSDVIYREFSEFLEQHMQEFIGKRKDALNEVVEEILTRNRIPKHLVNADPDADQRAYTRFHNAKRELFKKAVSNSLIVFKAGDNRNPQITHIHGFDQSSIHID